MSEFICTVEKLNELLNIVSNIYLPFTKLEAFSTGIRFAVESNLDDWFQLVVCIDGSIDLQAAYISDGDVKVVFLCNGNSKEIQQAMQSYIPGLDNFQSSKEVEEIESGNYLITELEDNTIPQILN